MSRYYKGMYHLIIDAEKINNTGWECCLGLFISADVLNYLHQVYSSRTPEDILDFRFGGLTMSLSDTIKKMRALYHFSDNKMLLYGVISPAAKSTGTTPANCNYRRLLSCANQSWEKRDDIGSIVAYYVSTNSSVPNEEVFSFPDLKEIYYNGINPKNDKGEERKYALRKIAMHSLISPVSSPVSLFLRSARKYFESEIGKIIKREKPDLFLLKDLKGILKIPSPYFKIWPKEDIEPNYEADIRQIEEQLRFLFKR